MRVISLGRFSFEIDPTLESQWPMLEDQARSAAELRGDAAPYIRFAAEGGSVGSIPVSAAVPIIFRDLTESDTLLGRITSVQPDE